jgi:MFS family permease
VFSVHGIENSFHVGREVAILSISLYVMGLGVGPLFAGPISELYGRNIVYRVSFALFFVFSFPVAFAPDIGTSNAGTSLPSVVQLN